MTHEEAVKILKEERVSTPVEYDMALELAIKALEYRAEVEKYGSELAMAIAHREECEAKRKELDAKWEECKRKYPSLGGQE